MPQPEFAGNDRYRVVRRLGVGGMGVVYEAEDRERGQRVALKSITRADSDLMYRLKREFRLLSDISHPNLVELYDLHADDSGCFYTMELVRGMDFVRYCAHRVKAPVVTGGASADADTQLGGAPPLRRNSTEKLEAIPERELACDERRLRSCLQQLALGLHALHETGKVHRDIKPSNVLVDSNGRVVLLDFGLVTDLGLRRSEQSLVGQVVGTAEFMAPEQAGGDGALTSAADWYAVGVMMYEAMTGRLPFVGDPMDMLYDKIRRAPPPPRAIVPTVPEDLDQLCEELLSRDPKKRPVGAEVLQRLGVDVGDAPVRPRVSRITQWVPFAGRERELDLLRDALSSIERGSASVVSISGPSGIGKTELIRTFFERVRHDREDLVVLEGRCYEREAVPYKAMDALIDHLSRVWMQLPDEDARGLVPRYATLLPRLFPVLGRVPAVATARGRREPAGAQEVRTRAFGALREVLQRLGDRRPLALFIDDMQWVDGDTVTLLADLMRPPDPPACMLLLSSRDAGEEERHASRDSSIAGDIGVDSVEISRTILRRDDGGPLDELLAGFGNMAQRIRLGRLSSEEAVELATRLLGAQAERYALRVAEESDGNPFVLGELARYVQAVQPGDVASVRLGDVVDHRISRLEDATRRLLEVVCVAGEPLSRRVAAIAAKLEPDEMTRELRLLGTSQLVRSPSGEQDRIEPYHNRFREAVLSGLSPADRGERHEALAVALEQCGEGTTEQLARHWFGAGRADRAATYALRAADEAVATLDFDRAARHLQMALAVGRHSPDQQRELLSRLGEAQSNSGRPLDAANAYLAASRTGTPHQRLELRRRAADELLGGGYHQQGTEAMREVLEQIDVSLPRTPRRALGSLLWRRAKLRFRGLGYKRRDESQLSPEELTRVDTLWSVAHGLLIVDVIVGTDFVTRYLSEALRLGEPVRVARAIALEAAVNGAMGDGRTHRMLARAKQAVAEVDDGLARGLLLWAEGSREYFTTNEWRGSLDHFQEADRVLRATMQSAGWESDNCKMYMCFNLLHLGKLRELSKVVPAFVREAERRGDRFFDVSIRARLGIVHLAADNPDYAAWNAENALSRWGQPTRFQVQQYFAMHAACEAALYAGDVDAAVRRFESDLPRLRKSLLTRVKIVAGETEYLRARIAFAARDVAGARRAQRALAKLRIPIARGYAQLVRAQVAAAEGDTDRAISAYRAVVKYLDASETRLYAHPARRRLGELVGGDEGAALVRKADDWAKRQSVVEPERFARLLVPA